MQLIMVKDLTIEHLDRMRGEEYLGAEADVLIDMIRTCNEGDYTEEELRKLPLHKAFNLGE